MNLKVAVFDGAMEEDLDLDSVGMLQCIVKRVTLDGVPAFLLGAVERPVRIAAEGFGIRSVLGVHCNPDTDRAIHGAPVYIEGVAQRSGERFRDLLGIFN